MSWLTFVKKWMKYGYIKSVNESRMVKCLRVNWCDKSGHTAQEID